MALAKFFIDQTDVVVGDSVTLSPQESHHAVKVRRMKLGDKVVLLNGLGAKFSGFIHKCDRNALVIRVESVTSTEPQQRKVNIAVALPKGDRQKQMLEMLAQLGVTSITPLICDNSVSKYSEKVAERWSRTLLEACKQSENPFLPQLNTAVRPLEYVERNLDELAERDGLICYADINGDLATTLALNDSLERISVLIGPEGGYSNSELSMLEKKGISSVRLSSYILRIETAAVVAAAAFVSK